MFEELYAEGVLALWIDRSTTGLTNAAGLSTWIVDGVGRTPVLPEKSMLKPPMGMGSNASGFAGAAAPHVPGVTPRVKQRRDSAPKLDKRPLPPL